MRGLWNGVPKDEVLNLNIWEGDKIFFRLLNEDATFFSMKLSYEGDRLVFASLDGKELELLDVVDEAGNPTGVARERALVHQNGDWHRTCHIWAARKDEEGEWEVMLQKRSPAKETYPGCYDCSAAGHVKAGGTCLDGAVRELKEELGITRYLRVPFGEIREDSQHEFHGSRLLERELITVYLYRVYGPAPEITLQEEEVESVCWMKLDQCFSLVRSGELPNCLDLRELEALKNFLDAKS